MWIISPTFSLFFFSCPLFLFSLSILHLPLLLPWLSLKIFYPAPISPATRLNLPCMWPPVSYNFYHCNKNYLAWFTSCTCVPWPAALTSKELKFFLFWKNREETCSFTAPHTVLLLSSPKTSQPLAPSINTLMQTLNTDDSLWMGVQKNKHRLRLAVLASPLVSQPSR